MYGARTTGLRGRMEAGWSRMNDLIVIQASQVRPMIFMLSELALTTVARDFVHTS